jgi:virginiamycin B lyase
MMAMWVETASSGAYPNQQSDSGMLATSFMSIPVSHSAAKRGRDAVMRTGNYLLNLSALLAVGLAQVGIEVPPARAQNAAALTGFVSSADEGLMEGVVISAKKDGATFTISVVSDRDGRYSFPATKLEPGHYSLSVRAGGYEIDSPKTVDLSAAQPATAEIRLRATKNFASQLTDAEWLASMPGTDSQKRILLGCNSCHTLERIVRSSHDAAEFLQIFKRMAGYYPGSTPLHPQRLVGDIERNLTRGANLEAAAQYLASVNLSDSTGWEYPLKSFPRPSGRATRVIFTEYDLPRAAIEPHDVIFDSGMVWFAEFGDQFLGKMDPRTGKVTEYPIPELKKGFPTGTLDLESGADGNSLWIGLMYQAGVAKFDKRSESFQLFALPPQWQSNSAQMGMVTPSHADVDGKVWTKNNAQNALIRIDLASGNLESLGTPKDPATNRTIFPYGIPADHQNNLYLLDFAGEQIAKVDAKTGRITAYKTPTANSRPRRGRVDAQDRLWFAEYGGNAIGLFDPNSQKITEWQLTTPWSAPYDVMPDDHGEVWAGGMFTDRVARLDPRTGQITEYLLPRSTNIRRVFVDSSTTPPTFWAGSNHGASIVKMEPQD